MLHNIIISMGDMDKKKSQFYFLFFSFHDIINLAIFFFLSKQETNKKNTRC